MLPSVLLLCISCLLGVPEPPHPSLEPLLVPASGEAARKQYWVDYGAEISRYTLKQRRYGALHDGTVVLVYVTEPFNPQKQVKEDEPETSAVEPVKVLKLNAMREFTTGIYRYNIMRSIFSPLADDAGLKPGQAVVDLLPLKQTQSIQEWCGMSFDQLNLGNDGYRHRGFSYFESAGDVDRSIASKLTEDALWNLIRIAPERLPLGEVQLLRGMTAARLNHTQIEAFSGTSTASLLKTAAGERIHYQVDLEDGRSLHFTFEAHFPHKIERYEERQGKQTLVEMERQQTIRSYYWSENQPKDEALRRKLGLN